MLPRQVSSNRSSLSSKWPNSYRTVELVLHPSQPANTFRRPVNLKFKAPIPLDGVRALPGPRLKAAFKRTEKVSTNSVKYADPAVELGHVAFGPSFASS